MILGRGYDTKGLFYRFYNVGTRYKNKGISDENKLYLKADNSLRGTSEIINRKTNKQYKFIVTQIRRNKHQSLQGRGNEKANAVYISNNLSQCTDNGFMGYKFL
ncbi:hypothetical protein NHP164001_17280 [Helicobacter trogontum]|uniref:Uncharacterized protein n=1 Tax=Helicobacter trogontum TaxID=50960 RepID=A0ABQ0D5V2_9HELI